MYLLREWYLFIGTQCLELVLLAFQLLGICWRYVRFLALFFLFDFVDCFLLHIFFGWLDCIFVYQLAIRICSTLWNSFDEFLTFLCVVNVSLRFIWFHEDMFIHRNIYPIILAAPIQVLLDLPSHSFHLFAFDFYSVRSRIHNLLHAGLVLWDWWMQTPNLLCIKMVRKKCQASDIYINLSFLGAFTNSILRQWAQKP